MRRSAVRFGELRDVDRHYQAEAFIQMIHIEGRVSDWEDCFGHWADTKDFHPGDAHVIRALVREALASTGDSTFTDIAAWFGFEEDAA